MDRFYFISGKKHVGYDYDNISLVKDLIHSRKVINRLSRKIQKLKRIKENYLISNMYLSNMAYFQRSFKDIAYRYLMKVEELYKKYSDMDYSKYDSDSILDELEKLIKDWNNEK